MKKDADDYNRDMKVVNLPKVIKKQFTDKKTGYTYWIWVFAK